MPGSSNPSDDDPAGGATNPLLALSGTVLESRYELGRVLGAGGMGAVYEAKHLRLERAVAIKVLRPVFVGHDEYIKRFLREAKVASKIRHRNVVEIHDYGEAAGGLLYSVMELLRGQDLDQFLQVQPGQRLSWTRASGLLIQVASGLKAAHTAGIIHRDVKPANCFLTTDDDGEPLIKVVDFGIAKAESAEHTQQLTGTAEVLGTPSYIAPELVLTKSPASPRSDIYSLGVVAYRMLTGRMPFTGDTPFQVLHNACFEPVPPLRGHVPDLSPAVEAFVLQMLAKAPGERPQDMQAVRDALAALARDTLGAQAVEIPVSSALPLGPVEPSGPFGSSTGTMPSGQAIGHGTRNAASHDVQLPTEVLLAPFPAAPGQPASRPMEAPRSVTVVPPVGAPQHAIYDPSSAPRSYVAEPTLPGAPEATLPLRGASSSIQVRPPRRGGMIWLGAAGGLAAVLAVGALGVQSMMDAPSEPAPPTVEPGADPHPEPEPTPAVTDDELEPIPQPEPEPIPKPEIEPVPPPDLRPAIEPTAPAPAPGIEPTPSPESGPKSETPTSKPPPPKSTPSGPPSDATQKKKLVRSIRTKCAKLMAGQSIDVFFIVLADGTVSGLTATPKGPAAQCALDEVKGVKFGKRPKTGSIRFTVK
jgi:serine/threonine protein kinase